MQPTAINNVLPPLPEMQQAFSTSDSSYDGIFFTAVRTTGIFCKPSCTARKPKPEHAEFYSSAREAVFAGYRPCKRCRPLDPDGDAPDWVNRLLGTIDQHPTDRLRDADIRAAGIDPARARRYFLKNYGMTFQAYSRGRRLGKSLEKIRLGADIDDVALGHGFESYSGFRSAFGAAFGSPPGESRSTDHITADWIESPLGPLIAGATAEGICLLEFTDRRMMEAQLAKLTRHFRCAITPGTTAHLRTLKKELHEYFHGSRKHFTVPLVFPGTPFQKKVWDELLRIPYGKTTSYQSIAQRVGSPGAVRAVGTANGMNRIAIVIPCHRVVNKNGKLGGYGGGLRRKQALLGLERGERSLL